MSLCYIINPTELPMWVQNAARENRVYVELFTLKDFRMIWGIVSLELRCLAVEKQDDLSRNWIGHGCQELTAQMGPGMTTQCLSPVPQLKTAVHCVGLSARRAAQQDPVVVPSLQAAPFPPLNAFHFSCHGFSSVTNHKHIFHTSFPFCLF